MRHSAGKYEAALADYLRSRGVPYVAVDEARRSIFAGAKIKSFDFIIYAPGTHNWLVEVKGRKFPYTAGGTSRYWENWVTRTDLDALLQWEAVFGEGFRAVLVFAYRLMGNPSRWPTLSVHPFGEEYYAFYRIPLTTYQSHCRPRSGRWGTVSLPTRVFRSLACPIEQGLADGT